MKHTYPFANTQPLLSEVVAFIAKYAYPGKSIELTVKRVRESIRTEGKNWVNYSAEKPIITDVEGFFTWARTKKKWSEGLSKIENLPYEPITATCSIGFPVTKITAHAVETPQIFDELEKSFITQASEIFELKQKNTQQENTIAELNLFKQASIKRSSTNAINGAKAKGVPKRRSE